MARPAGSGTQCGVSIVGRATREGRGDTGARRVGRRYLGVVRGERGRRREGPPQQVEVGLLQGALLREDDAEEDEQATPLERRPVLRHAFVRHALHVRLALISRADTAKVDEEAQCKARKG